eukprot:861706_1
MPSIINGKSKPAEESPQLEEQSSFNSTTKVQSFFGCDDIDELKSNKMIQKVKVSNKKSQKLKKIFSMRLNKHYINKKRRKGTKRIRKNQHKSSLSAPNISPMTNNEKIRWRPSLKILYNDSLLLKTLIAFMEKSYNSENILFLLSVKKLQKSLLDLDTIFNITCIYNTYIIPTSPHQINLSYHSFVNVLSKKDKFNTFDINTKHAIFNECVTEIEQLMVTSILPSFYSSNMFQSVAKQSKFYESYLLKVMNSRPSLSCELFNSTTELLNDVKLD